MQSSARVKKYLFALDPASGWVGVLSDELYRKGKEKTVLLIDVYPEFTYFQVDREPLLILGWIETTGQLTAFQRMPRTFHEVSYEGRKYTGFLPQALDAAYFANRGIKRSGEEV